MECDFNLVVGVQLLVNGESDCVVLQVLGVHRLFTLLLLLCSFLLLLFIFLSFFLFFFSIVGFLLFRPPPVCKVSPNAVSAFRFSILVLVPILLLRTGLRSSWLGNFHFYLVIKVPVLLHLGKEHVVGSGPSLRLKNGRINVDVCLFSVHSPD